MAKVDLHIHSTESDGKLSPAEVVYKSVERGVTIVALADHDSVAGVVPALVAAKVFPGLKIIPGVEISTDVPGGEVHVLGYFIDYADPKLLATLERMRNSRRERARRMVVKLGDLDVHINWARVQEIAGSGSIGRPHLAQAMLEKGYIASLKEAFDRYISRNGPAYVEREKMTPPEAVELVLQANGLPVLAHPLTISDLETVVVELKAAGLVGLEAYYSDYTTDEINRLVKLVDRHRLIATGGSDYHGLETSGTMIGGADVPLGSAEQLIALAEQRALKQTG